MVKRDLGSEDDCIDNIQQSHLSPTNLICPWKQEMNRVQNKCKILANFAMWSMAQMCYSQWTTYNFARHSKCSEWMKNLFPKNLDRKKSARHTHTFDRLFFANKSSYEKKHRIWTNKKTTNEKHRHINGVCHAKKCDVSVKYTCSQPKKMYSIGNMVTTRKLIHTIRIK